MGDPALQSAFPLSTRIKRTRIDASIHAERDFQDSRFPESNPSITGLPDTALTKEEETFVRLGYLFGEACRYYLKKVEGTPHVTNGVRLAILGEEMGEICEAMLRGDALETGRELLQTVAVGYAWMEALPLSDLDALITFRQAGERTTSDV